MTDAYGVFHPEIEKWNFAPLPPQTNLGPVGGGGGNRFQPSPPLPPDLKAIKPIKAIKAIKSIAPPLVIFATLV